MKNVTSDPHLAHTVVLKNPITMKFIKKTHDYCEFGNCFR